MPCWFCAFTWFAAPYELPAYLHSDNARGNIFIVESSDDAPFKISDPRTTRLLDTRATSRSRIPARIAQRRNRATDANKYIDKEHLVDAAMRATSSIAAETGVK